MYLKCECVYKLNIENVEVKSILFLYNSMKQSIKIIEFWYLKTYITARASLLQRDDRQDEKV